MKRNLEEELRLMAQVQSSHIGAKAQTEIVSLMYDDIRKHYQLSHAEMTDRWISAQNEYILEQRNPDYWDIKRQAE